MLKTTRAALAALLLTLTLAGIASAQTTYTNPGPSTCLSAGYNAPTSPYGFACDSSGSVILEKDAYGRAIVYIEFYGNRVGVFTPEFAAWGEMTAVTNWVAPVCPWEGHGGPCTTPGAIAFNWEVTNNSGVTRTGTFSGDIPSYVRTVRGYFEPQFTQIVFTVNPAGASAAQPYNDGGCVIGGPNC